ncbi:MAG TPA: c-type cytochrome [Rhizomicrobium sp.]
MFKIALLAVAMVAASAGYAQAQDAVARGKYLAILGDCAGCHTQAATGSPPYAGGLAFVAAFGTLYSPNITQDKHTGIGSWTADQFYHTLHAGVGAGGKHLYPAFPFPYFTHITRADSDAIYAYLRTIKPVRAVPPPNRLIPPFDIRAMMVFWDAMFFKEGTFANDPSKSAVWNRGNYIVNGFGHCAACHTPKNILFGDETDKALTGGTQQGWFSANLNGNRRDGLGKWSAADIVQYLKTGRNKYAWAAGSMQEKITSSTSHMHDDDLMAIATYLKSLPAAPESTPSAPDASAMQRGRDVFVANCSACHSEPGAGTPREYPDLAGDTLIVGRDSQTVLRILLQGAQSAQTPNAPTTYSMPGFAALRNQDIADVATYIRNAWGNRAGSVSAKDVKKLREALVTGKD